MRLFWIGLGFGFVLGILFLIITCLIVGSDPD